MIRFSAKRLSDFWKIKYLASFDSLKVAIPKSVPLSLFRIVITRLFLICDWRWRSTDGFCHSVYTCGLPQFSITWAKRAVLILRSFIANQWTGLMEWRGSPYRSPPENYGKEDHTTVAAFLPWRGL